MTSRNRLAVRGHLIGSAEESLISQDSRTVTIDQAMSPSTICGFP
jgi:hypothetical protein